MGSRRSAGHLAGLCGICLYYLLENIALTYTMASNVGVIISVAPFFTAVLSRLFPKSEGKLRANFFIGFVVAMAGVALISFNGSEQELNPVGEGISAGMESGYCAAFATKEHFNNSLIAREVYQQSTENMKYYMQRQWSLVEEWLARSRRWNNRKRERCWLLFFRFALSIPRKW